MDAFFAPEYILLAADEPHVSTTGPCAEQWLGMLMTGGMLKKPNVQVWRRRVIFTRHWQEDVIQLERLTDVRAFGNAGWHSSQVLSLIQTIQSSSHLCKHIGCVNLLHLWIEKCGETSDLILKRASGVQMWKGLQVQRLGVWCVNSVVA